MDQSLTWIYVFVWLLSYSYGANISAKITKPEYDGYNYNNIL